jgi:AraC-like DNA-binding protein
MIENTPIPIYTIHDLAHAEHVADFELKRLESAFAQARRNVIGAHRHDYYEICWITGGAGRLLIDFTGYAIMPPMLCFFSPGQVHAWAIDAPITGYIVRFTTAFFATSPQQHLALAELPWFYAIDSAPVLAASPAERGQIDPLWQRMEQEYTARRDQHLAALRAYLQLILIEAARLHCQAPPAASEADYLLTKRFLLLVEQHYRTHTSVAHYAERLHVTANHLNVIVRHTMARSAGTIVRERLLLEAKRLLCYTELTIAEIAAQLGFDDPSYFGRFFKKHSGMSRVPSASSHKKYQIWAAVCHDSGVSAR